MIFKKTKPNRFLSACRIFLPQIFSDFYLGKSPEFELNPDYDKTAYKIIYLMDKKNTKIIDNYFNKINKTIREFRKKWWEKYRKEVVLNKNFDIVKNSALTSKIAKFKLLHTMSEFLEIYEIIKDLNVSPKEIKNLLPNDFAKIKEEFADAYISILLTANFFGISLLDINEVLERKIIKRQKGER
jgi:NTP pyrophosphatase (non-canonical NTP hydrolase)